MTFDLAVVISLPRRADRLAAFRARFAAAWPGMRCEVFPAVDGELEALPHGWTATSGAYGCYRSHQAVIASALCDDVDRLVVLEDDATFVADFAERLSDLAIPADCEQLYLGGEHLEPPLPGPPGFVRGQNVNRTHAYAVLGRRALLTLRQHLRWNPATWGPKHHVDHRYGELHERGGIVVYAVAPWLCGQAAGPSDVDGKAWPERAWP